MAATDFEFQVALDTSPVLRQILDIGRRLDETFARVKPLGITADTSQAETKLSALAKTVIKPRIEPDFGTFSSRFDKQLHDAEKKVIALQSELAGAILEGASVQEVEKIRQALGAAEGEAKKFRAALNSAQGISANSTTDTPTSPVIPNVPKPPKDIAFEFNNIFNAITNVSSGLTAFTEQFTSLDNATQKIKTLGGSAKELAPTFRQVAVEMGSQFPIAAAEIQTATYDALSAGVNASEKDIKAFMTAAGKLAVGGSETIGNAVNILSSQVNAYGLAAEDAAKVSDILFTTVNLGKTSIPELNASLSNVIPTASAAGVSLENVGASLALMTANGVPTAQSTTKLNQLLLEMQKPGAALAPILKKAGVSLESLKNESLPDNLRRINDALKSTGQTATQAFSSSEASAAFKVLTKDLDKFDSTLTAFQGSAGATESAFQDMSQGIDNRVKAINASFESMKTRFLDMGGDFTAWGVVAANTFGSLAPQISALTGIFGAAMPIIQAWGATSAAAGVEAAAGTAVAGTTATATGFSFASMWLAATGPVGLVIAGIIAVVAIIAVLYNKFDSVRQVLDAVFDGIVSVFKKIGSALAEFGGFIVDLIVAPFQLVWAVISPLVDIVSDLFSSMFGGATDASGAVDGIAAVFEFLGDVIDTVKGLFAGFRAGLAEFIAIVGEIADAVVHLDFSRAAKVASTAGARIGNALISGAKDSIAQSNLNDELEKATKTLGDGLKVKAKLSAIDGIDSLQKSLVSAQEQLKPLEVKIKAGTATEEEKKSFEQLQKKVVETSAKIAEIAPEANAGTRTMVSANGELIDVYEINSEKLGDIAKKQKEAYGKDIQNDQKKYSDSLVKVANTLDAQKKKLGEVKAAIDAANAKGDTKTAERLKEEYSKLNEQIKENSAGLKKGFEDGAKAGLLTKDATDKVGTSLGIAQGKAGEVADQLKKAGEEAEKAAFNVNAIGDAFNAAQKAAKDLLDKSQTNAAGIKTDLADLGKSLSLDDAKKKYSQDFQDIAEARKFLNQQLAAERKKAAQAENDGFRLEALGRAEDRAVRRADAEKNRTTSLSEQKRLNDEKLQKDIEAARAKAILEKKSEEELQVEILQLQLEAKDREFLAEIETKRAILAGKKGLSAAEIRQENEAINTVKSNRFKAYNEGNAKIDEAEGKARTAKLERERKALDDVTKLSIDSAQRRIDALQTVEAQTVANAEKLATERVELAKIKGAEEVKAFIEGTKEFKDAELVIQADVKAGNIDSTEAIKQLEQLRKDIADGLLTGADAVSAAYNALTRKQAADEAKLRIENASAIEKARLNTIENAEIRQRELAIAEAKKQYAEELRLAGDNENLQYLAFKKFKAAQVAAEALYLEQTRSLYEKSAIGLLTKLSEAISKAFNPDPKAQEEAKKGLDELAKKEKELYKARAANSISFEDFQKQLADLSKQEAELKDKLGDVGFNVGTAFKNAFGDALSGVAGIMSNVATTSTKLFGEQRVLSFKIANEVEELESEKLGASVERRAEIDKKLDVLKKNQTKSTQEATKAQSDAYESLAISAAAHLGAAVLSGKNTAHELVYIAFDTLNTLIPIFIAQIFGAFVAANPLLGAALAGVATGVLQGLVASAKNSLKASGFRTGGYTGDAPVDSVTGLVHGQEIVFEAPIVKGQKREVLELRRIMQTGVSAAEILNAYKKPPMLSDWSVGATGILTVPQHSVQQMEFEQIALDFSAALERIDVRVKEISVKMPVVYKQDNTEVLKELREINRRLEKIEAAQYETAKEYRAHTSVEMSIKTDSDILKTTLKSAEIHDIMRG